MPKILSGIIFLKYYSLLKVFFLFIFHGKLSYVFFCSSYKMFFIFKYGYFPQFEINMFCIEILSIAIYYIKKKLPISTISKSIVY